MAEMFSDVLCVLPVGTVFAVTVIPVASRIFQPRLLHLQPSFGPASRLIYSLQQSTMRSRVNCMHYWEGLHTK